MCIRIFYFLRNANYCVPIRLREEFLKIQSRKYYRKFWRPLMIFVDVHVSLWFSLKR
jgi:hypothetical protein